MNAVITLSNVVKEFAGTPPVRALDGIDLRVDEGEFVAIVGPSGSGKSTLLNLLGALDKPTEGTVEIDGVAVATQSDKELSALRGRRIGFVFQSFNLIDGLDAVDNVGIGLLYAGMQRKQRRQLATEALERVGLAHRSTHLPSRMSGGERQRVAIARAIVTQPALLLADEPTGNLDTKTGDEIIDVFTSLHREGATIILITHDLRIANRAPRRVTMIDGRIAVPEGAAV